MQAVVLAGGEGTRLRPLTETIPKTVLPLCGRPFTAYTIDWLERHGVDEVVLSCGYLADGMKSALEGASGPRLVFEVEPEPLGTAGAIGHCRDLVGDTFFAMNGRTGPHESRRCAKGARRGAGRRRMMSRARCSWAGLRTAK